MTRLGSTIQGLTQMNVANFPFMGETTASRLGELVDFGANPGALRARCYTPPGLAAGAPLVVVLHGCTQSAGAYDHGAGWSQLADELGLALLFPEQQRANNPNLCFNWFSPIDARRGSGEVLSIREMIAAMVAEHAIDVARIFVTGLSAGGAMASNLLASYPEVFAGGAIIAGLPFGAARSVNDAFSRMRGEGYPEDAQLAEALRAASDHQGRWPRISVWQGMADTTVAPSNAERILGQWRGVHGVSDPAQREEIAGSRRRTWRNAAGEAVLEAYEIPGMGHGTPVHSAGPAGCGAKGPFMLEAGISSTRRIAGFWGLTREVPQLAAAGVAETRAPQPSPLAATGPAAWQSGGVGAIIQDALRKAGLMR